MSTVRVYRSTDPGAPPHPSATRGSMAALIRACLVAGYGNIAIDGITVTGGIATATITNNTLEVGTVIEITGATPAELNAEWKITAADSGTITFSTPGIADVTATGTIGASIPAAGWEEPYAETNHKACFRALTGDRKFYQIDDNHDATYSGRAILRGFDSMSDAETGVGWESWCYIGKRAYNDYDDYLPTTGRWVVVTDEKTVYVFLANRYGYCPHGFGEYESFFAESDSFISGHLYDYSSSDCMPATATLENCGIGLITPSSISSLSANFIKTRRDKDGLLSPTSLGLGAASYNTSRSIIAAGNTYIKSENEGETYYNSKELLRIVPLVVGGSASASDLVPIGFLRGLLHPAYYVYNEFISGYSPEIYTSFSGRDIGLFWTSHHSGNSSATSLYGGYLALDISDSWEV